MTVLNDADEIRIGSRQVDEVYLGSNLIWEPAGWPWTPHEIEDTMWGWWDASIPSSLTWSGIYLLEIADQGPNNIHMGRAASSGPTATTLNGLGALAFTYDQGLMTPVLTTFNDFTIHAAFNPGFSDGNTYERIVDHSYELGWWFGRRGSTQTFGGGIQEGPEVQYGIYVPLANNEVHQISNVREGAVHRISGNGGAVVGSRAIHTNVTASNRVYMAQDNLGLSDVTDGEIGEVIIWKRALSADEMAKTEGYLAHKWGIKAKLPAGHPYKTKPPTAGHSAKLLTSFAPGGIRSDFQGEVGVRLNIIANKTFTWIGAMASANGLGLQRVAVYNFFTLALIAEGTVDFTGKAPGEWAWVRVPPFALLTDPGYYALVANTYAGGAGWANAGQTAFDPAITGNIYLCYRGDNPAWGFDTATPNMQFFGLDLGWSK